jgi:hypothetical protein
VSPSIAAISRSASVSADSSGAADAMLSAEEYEEYLSTQG